MHVSHDPSHDRKKREELENQKQRVDEDWLKSNCWCCSEEPGDPQRANP